MGRYGGNPSRANQLWLPSLPPEARRLNSLRLFWSYARSVPAVRAFSLGLNETGGSLLTHNHASLQLLNYLLERPAPPGEEGHVANPAVRVRSTGLVGDDVRSPAQPPYVGAYNSPWPPPHPSSRGRSPHQRWAGLRPGGLIQGPSPSPAVGEGPAPPHGRYSAAPSGPTVIFR